MTQQQIYLVFLENCITFLFIIVGCILLKVIYRNYKKLYLKIKNNKEVKNER